MSKTRRYANLLNQEELHRVGYTVIPGAIEIPIEVLENLTKQVGNNGVTIFGYDKRRKQCNLSTRAKYVQRFVSELNDCISGLVSHPNYVQSNWVVLRSKAGSLRQQTHHDYEPSAALSALPNEEFPLGIICTLMPDTTLDVWPNGEHRIAILNPGDILIFRGDFTHAGSAYDKENVRLHCYMDNKTVPRTPNRTHIVREDKNNNDFSN